MEGLKLKCNTKNSTQAPRHVCDGGEYVGLELSDHGVKRLFWVVFCSKGVKYVKRHLKNNFNMTVNKIEAC